MAHWIDAQGQVNVAKKTQPPTCDVQTENPKHKTKKLFFKVN